jgi:hypothetical protein
LAVRAENADALVIVSRDRHGWRDRARSYGIVMDGEQIAKIKRGQRIELPVASGHHQILVQINWGSSQAINLDIRPGQSVEPLCGTGPSQAGVGYISLKPV